MNNHKNLSEDRNIKTVSKFSSWKEEVFNGTLKKFLTLSQSRFEASDKMINYILFILEHYYTYQFKSDLFCMVDDKGVKRSDPTEVKNCMFFFFFKFYETVTPSTKNKRSYIYFRLLILFYLFIGKPAFMLFSNVVFLPKR